jgi:flagellar protein FlgJ
MTIEPISHELQGPNEAQQRAKLVDGAEQFEAMMLQEMLKPLKFGSVDPDADNAKGGDSETMRGFATEAVGKALAKGGGFGLARQIIRQVTLEQEGQNMGKQAESVTKV